MKVRIAKGQNADFEPWARLLLRRKVPDDCHHLIDSEVVIDGADILKRGEAFEVRISDGKPGFIDKQILVTPFPVHFHPAGYETRHRSLRLSPE